MFDLLIIYKSTANATKVIHEVTNYGASTEGDFFWYQKNGYKSFCPINSVLFFGRDSDYI